MLNLISSQQALFVLQTRECRVARESWPWGMWIESSIPWLWESGHAKTSNVVLYENDKPTSKLWEKEFEDHNLNDWYILEPRPIAHVTST